MEAPVRVDLIHTAPVVTAALRRRLEATQATTRIGTALHSWIDFQREWDFAGEYVLVDALLDDHVPLPLKVRALTRAGSGAIVIGPGRHTPFARRVHGEGAIAWLDPRTPLVEIGEQIHRIVAGQIPSQALLERPAAPRAALTDRQIQVLTLFVAARGHSPAFLAKVLGLRTETIRSHLERGRAPYRAAGLATRDRAALRAALIADGWILDPEIWLAAGRP